MSNRKDDKLESKTIPYQLFTDKGGKFLAYCTDGRHPGLIQTPLICQKRHCSDYHKFYVLRTNMKNHQRR